MGTDGKPVGLWDVLPASLRSALTIALATSVVAGALLYRSGFVEPIVPGSGRGPTISDIADGDQAFEDFTIPSPGPGEAPTSRPRSKATLTAPTSTSEPSPAATGQLPTFGTYVYSMEGGEAATAFGSREYPPEMTMTVQRPNTFDDEQRLEDDELVFDLFFHEEHEEREIVSFSEDGIAFTYESSSVTFGPVTQATAVDFDPPIIQIPPAPKPKAEASGTSRAISEEGEERWVEDWSVKVEGAEEVQALGESIPTWKVVLERASRPGSADQMAKKRIYWFDPSRSIWVKWEESTRSTGDFGPGSFTYRTDFIATLDRIEPL